MNKRIDEVVRDTYRYYYIDGLVEIAVGFLFLLIGLALYGWITLDMRSWPGVAAILALILLASGGSLIVKRLVSMAKERLTYERTGYVAYELGEPQASRWPVVLAAVLLILLMSILPEQLNRMPFVIGTFLGITLGYMGNRVRLTRFYLLGFLAFLAGLAATLWFEDELVGATVTFAVTGVAMILSGGLVLLNYLRQHPASTQE